MSIKKELATYINKWIELSNKQHEIVKYLFNRTELFEEKYIYNYKEDIFRFFAGKINRNAKEINQLMSYMTENDKEILAQQKIKEY